MARTYNCAHFRLLSRVVIIPFKGPSIQVHTPEQQVAFSSLRELKEASSQSIGFYIALGKRFRNEGAFEVDGYEKELLKLLPNCGGRTIKGYASLLWFTEQVSIYSLNVVQNVMCTHFNNYTGSQLSW